MNTYFNSHRELPDDLVPNSDEHTLIESRDEHTRLHRTWPLSLWEMVRQNRTTKARVSMPCPRGRIFLAILFYVLGFVFRFRADFDPYQNPVSR
jgi:hypothetical protein